MSVIKLNNENFENEVLKKEGTVLVDLYADWCGPCKMVAPIVAEIAEERTDITVGKINVDECPELAQRYGVAVIPTLFVIKNGEKAATTKGYMDADGLRAFVSNAI